ncbi:ABC transporter permease [Candidatus Woesearchaeota archaeon]|nr:ABC transporter permease [Candidatus Woesearchaeota archaeon]
MPLRKLLKSVKLQVQKLDTMLLNDIRLFLRDRKSLILVALTPFLILAILINIFYFSDVSENIRGVKLAVCDQDGRGFDLESEIFDTEIFTGECESVVAEKVSSGEFRGAVVIPKNFRQDLLDGRGSEITMFIDNSKQTTAVVTSNAVKAYVADMNEQMGTAFILEAWKQLKELNDNLRFLVDNLNRAVPLAKELKVKLNDISRELDSVDFESHQQTVDELVGFLNLMEIQLNYVNDSFSKVNPALPDIPSITYTPNASIAIAEYYLSSGKWKTLYCDVNSSIPILTSDPTCMVIDYTDSIMSELEAQSANLSSYQADLNSRIAELNSKSAEIDAALFRLSGLVDSGSEQNQQVRSDIQTVRDSLLFLKGKSGNITESIHELDRSMDQFLSDIIRVTAELEQTIAVLDAYTRKDPATILQPVKVQSKPVFKDKLEIFYRLPALISIILLFITLFISSSLIVNERRGGTMARIFLSPISMFFYVFEKMAYLLLLCMVAVLSMVLATLAFRVPLELSLDLFLVFIVASLVYIALGVMIGSFSKSENTSLLTCLVIGFPLMFLSGAFNPPELMDKFMRVASQYLPLTLNINLLEKITIYRTGMDPAKLLVMVGMIAVFYVLAVLMIRKKPTLK